MDFRRGETFHAFFDDKTDDSAILSFCPNNCDISDGRVGNPHFGTIQDVGIAVVFHVGKHPVWIGACIGFGEAEAADEFAFCQFGQVMATLLFGAEFINRVHHQRTLHGSHGAHAGVAAFQFLHDDAVGDFVHAAAAILCREGGAKGTDFGQTLEKVCRAFGTVGVVFDDRADFGFHPVAHGIAGEQVFG